MDEALDDGLITGDERRAPHELRVQLGLSQVDAEAILAKESRQIFGRCPHCDSDLDAPVSRSRRQAGKPLEIARRILQRMTKN